MKIDRNGYAPSLFDTESGTCFCCGAVTDTARHEVFGASNRDNSKRYGLWINVCPPCHDEIHKDSNGRYLFLKVTAQRKFQKAYPGKDFLTIFGRNYL